MIEINGIGEIFNEVTREGGLFQRIFGKGRAIGTIVDQNDGTPLSKVKITLSDTKGHHQVEETTLSGRFIFEKIRGILKCSLEYKGTSIENFDVLVVNGGEKRTLEYQIDPELFEPSVSSSVSASPSADLCIELNGAKISGHSVPEFYQNALELLVSKGLLKEEHLPFATSKQRYLVASEPIHPSEKKFFTPVSYGKYFMESNISRARAVEYLKRLIDSLGTTQKPAEPPAIGDGAKQGTQEPETKLPKSRVEAVKYILAEQSQPGPFHYLDCASALAERWPEQYDVTSQRQTPQHSLSADLQRHKDFTSLGNGLFQYNLWEEASETPLRLSSDGGDRFKSKR